VKLLLLLFFFAVFYGAKLLYRLAGTASAALAAAKEANGVAPGMATHGLALQVQREAAQIANHVGEVVPGARKVAYDFASWAQLLMSLNVPGAVRPDELQPPGARTRAAVFLAGALEAFAEHAGLSFTNGVDFERFMRVTLTRVGAGFLSRECVEVGMRFLTDEPAPEVFGLAWAAGGTAVRMELRGHAPLPYENALRDSLHPAPTALLK
jgi:hypothetical protein